MSRILIAEDNKIERELFEELLAPLGHNLELCKNGKEALEAFKNNSADLVILDYKMPVINGIKVCKKIRQDPKGTTVPILIISGYHEEDIITEALNSGATDYILKPMDDNLFIAKIKSYLTIYALHQKDSELIRNKTLFAGRYRIEKLIGCGTHSTILLATDETDKFGQVAIKLLMENTSEEKYASTFIETANKFKKIDCPNIVKIFDSGQFAGRLYLIMEYIPDGDLSSLLKRKTLSEYDTAELIADIGNAIKTLKENEIIHFDIKPENILINGHTFLLTDFGIMPEQDRRTISISHADLWTTLSYVAPEFLDPEYKPDKKYYEASDVYSLGIVAYEAFTGKNPFDSKKTAVTISKQVNYIPPELTQTQKKILSELSDLVENMLSKNPEDRLTVNDLNESIETILKILVDKPPVFIDSKIELHKREVAEKLPSEEQEEIHNDEITQSHSQSSSIQLPPDPPQQGIINRSRYQVESNKVRHSVIIHEFAQNLRLFVTIAILTVILASLSYGAYKFLFSQKYTEYKGSLRAVNCTSCNHQENRNIIDISKEKCSKCGKQTLAYAIQCRRCGKRFCLKKDKIKTKDLSRTEYIQAMKELKRCPACNSEDTEFAMTDDDLIHKLEQK